MWGYYDAKTSLSRALIKEREVTFSTNMSKQVQEVLMENNEELEADQLYYTWGYMPDCVGNFVRLNKLIECVERMVEEPDTVEDELETIRDNNLLDVVKPFQRNFTIGCKESKYNLSDMEELPDGREIWWICLPQQERTVSA